MQEKDISSWVIKAIKYLLPAIVAVAFILSSLLWYILYGIDNIVLRDAKVTGNMIGVRARVQGTVAEVFVNNEEQVVANTLLMRVKVAITKEEIEHLQQALALATKNVEKLQKGVVVQRPIQVATDNGTRELLLLEAEKQAIKMEELYQLGAISARQRDEARGRYEELRASQVNTAVTYEEVVKSASPEILKRAELKVLQAKAALEAAEADNVFIDIYSQVEGNVYLDKDILGKALMPGEVVAYIGDPKEIWVEAYLDFQEASQVRVGQLASCRLQRKKYRGLVLEIDRLKEENMPDMATSIASTKGNGERYYVRISLPVEAIENFKPGEQAEICIEAIQ